MTSDDQIARSLQDMGIDPVKLAEWDQSEAGKAANQRFQEMCERGEIFHASNADLSAIEFLTDPVEEAVGAFDAFVREWIGPRHHAHLMDNDDNAAERVRRAIRALRGDQE
ncbi:hypothetical protein [Mycobacterium sp. BK086]|uniref:hypothetical protein n=1 Tax=Mycobacterium sp. BK086 TaxID=2512165 RepID=UPI00105E9609|nr:hypothetical protein [Mycobacterium sp. BK086]